MSASSRLLTLTLGLTAIGCGALAYQQYYLLQAARDSIAALEKERASLHARIAQLEKSRSERSRWSPGPAAGAESGPIPVPATNGDAPTPAPGPRGEGGFGRMRAMMESPQAQQLMAMQQKAALDGRYASLFRKLNLSPADLEKFKALLVERQTAAIDVMAAARNQGLDMRSSREEINQLIGEAQTEVDNSIRGMLGDTGYQDYKDYERTLPTRGTVNQLEQRLSYSSTPLRADQADQLARILADTNPPRSDTMRASGGPMFFGADGAVSFPGGAFYGGAGGNSINDDAITRAQGVLSTEQMDALKQLQQEQQTRAQLSQDMRRNLGRTNGTTSSSGGPIPIPVQPTPGGG